MQTLPSSIYSVASVREIDRTAIEDHAIPGYALMSRAGEAALQAARRRYPAAERWQVICGAGNNAGDGYVVARLAAAAGLDVSVLALADPQSLRGDAAKAYGDFVDAGGAATPWAGELDATADLIVDAVLGSGLQREVSGTFAEAVSAINAHGAVVVALDIPTGLHGDTGQPMGTAVIAELTVTFVGLKSGLFLGLAPDYCGEVTYAGLDIPDECRNAVTPELRRIDKAVVQGALPRRRRTAHKGECGHVLVVGGGAGMPGAVRLCGEAALRAGAGRVSIATDPSHAALLASTRPELMSHGILDPRDLEALMKKADVIAFGPGLGRSDWANALCRVMAADSRPAVWDADALNWLAENPGTAASRIITPHPGEAGVLLGQSTASIQSNRPAALRDLQSRFGGVAVLKGAGSLILGEMAPPWICTSGNPGMAAAGMGDVLTGIIAALLAQGLAFEQAAIVGVECHARAGDRAARKGERGLLAGDLIAELRAVINA